MGGMVEVGEGAYNSLEDKHMDIEDLWHMEGDVSWIKCRKVFQNSEPHAPRTRSSRPGRSRDDHGVITRNQPDPASTEVSPPFGLG